MIINGQYDGVFIRIQSMGIFVFPYSTTERYAEQTDA